MENARVAAALMQREAAFLFEDDDARGRSRSEQRMRGGQTDDPASDDRDVEIIHRRVFSAGICAWVERVCAAAGLIYSPVLDPEECDSL